MAIIFNHIDQQLCHKISVTYPKSATVLSLKYIAMRITIGVIHKVRTLRFRNFRPSFCAFNCTGEINCTGEMEMDNFGCLNSSFSSFYFYFVTNLRGKKLLRTYVYS